MPRLKRIILNGLLLIAIVSVISEPTFSLAQEKDNKIAGEFFGIPVSLDNYYFAKRVVLTFNAKWRGIPRTERELEDLVWQELLFSYEAFRRGIEVTDKEINDEIDKILKEEKVEFSWRDDVEEFKKWTEEKLKESVELFRNQVEHLVKIEKLRQQVLDSIKPDVTEQEAYQKFLDEYNTLSVELIQFDNLQEAQSFYRKISKNPEVWQQRKKQEPKIFKRPGFVALDFLIHMWGFHRDDAYKMIESQVNTFYPPAPIYKGYAVFKILQIRRANTEEFAKRRDYYFRKIENIKKYEGFKKWAKELKESAHIKILINSNQ